MEAVETANSVDLALPLSLSLSKVSTCFEKLYSNSQTFGPSSVHVRGFSLVPSS